MWWHQALKKVKRASQSHVSSSSDANKVENPHQVSWHIPSHQMVSNGKQAHHLDQTLAHDIIIKEPNIMVREPLSKVEWSCTTYLSSVQAKPSATFSIKWSSKVWGHYPKCGLSAHVCHHNHICQMQAHLSIVQGPEDVRACIWVCQAINWLNALHHTCHILKSMHNILGESNGHPSKDHVRCIQINQSYGIK